MLSEFTARDYRDVWEVVYTLCRCNIDRMPLTNDFIIAFPFD